MGRHAAALARTTSAVAGALLGAAFGVTAGLRRSKPLHPVGVVGTAVLNVEPRGRRSGSPLLDTAGRHDCLVRASHALGTGPEYADIEGFALRLPREGGWTDLLFASTGDSALGRYSLTVRPPGRHGVQTTLLPVRTRDGRPLQLRLEPLDPGSRPWPGSHALSWAHGAGAWQRCGTLEVDWSGPADAPERFDPVLHPLPGTTQYPVVALLREPAYRSSRLVRPSAGSLPADPAPTTPGSGLPPEAAARGGTGRLG